MTEQNNLPLYSPEQVDLRIFNAIKSPDYGTFNGKPVKEMKRLFYKQIIVDDETIMSSETIKVPGYIGIADQDDLIDPDGNAVSGHGDIVKYLNEYGILPCTYVYHKDAYGRVVDLRWILDSSDETNLMELIIKGGEHHTGAIVPAIREGNPSFASLNEPDTYHAGMFGHPGFVAIAQGLEFPEFVTKTQARGYTDTIICWLAVMNSFVEFSENDFNGGDPVRVCDRNSLQEFLKNCALAALGSTDAIDFLNLAENKAYCAEFIYIGLNSPLYPFNHQGLTKLLDGDATKAEELLKLQNRQNNRQVNLLSKTSQNPEFQNFTIQMPVVPEDLIPLDELMTQHGENIDTNSIPFPPFTLTQVVRRAIRTLLPRKNDVNNVKIAQAQANLFASLEPLIFKQLGITPPPSPPLEIPGVPIDYSVPDSSPTNTTPDPRIAIIREFIGLIQQQLQQPYQSYIDFDQAIDQMMEKTHELLANSGVQYFIPPRIYIDLGQNDGDDNLPKGWGFKLKTVGALIFRGAIRSAAVNSNNSQSSVSFPNHQEQEKEPENKPKTNQPQKDAVSSSK